jgi:hypothetical protein
MDFFKKVQKNGGSPLDTKGGPSAYADREKKGTPPPLISL